MAVRRSYFQTAWVVHDIGIAIHRWVEQALIGPFFLLPHSRIDDSRYHGSPVTIDISVAVAQVGPMQIELIEQHDGQPSPFTVDLPQPGIHHHIAATTDDLDADIRYYENRGVEPVFTGLSGHTPFAFFDTRSSLGCLTEIMQRDPSVEGLFELIDRAGADWDGSEPIRSLPS